MRLLKLETILISLFINFSLSCENNFEKISALFLEVQELKNDDFYSLSADDLYHLASLIDENFDFVIINNLRGDEDLKIINDRFLFSYYNYSYFIKLEGKRTVSILSKREIKDLYALENFVNGSPYYYGISFLIFDFNFVILNFQAKYFNYFDLFLIEKDLKTLNFSLKNICFLTDLKEFLPLFLQYNLISLSPFNRKSDFNLAYISNFFALTNSYNVSIYFHKREHIIREIDNFHFLKLAPKTLFFN